jgi:hypothetical protein
MAILAYLGIRNLLPTRLTPTQSDAVVGSLPTFDIDGTRPPVTTPELASATPQPSAATQTTAQAVTMSPTGLPTPVLFDDFSTLINDWPQGDQAGGGYNYADGAYLIEVLENGSLYWAAPKGSFSDLKMSVAAQRVSGDQGYYGLLCRIQDNQNFYYFIVRPDGQFTIGKYESGEFTALTPGGWTYHPTIQIGNAVNHLEAECAGDQLRFSANGEVLGEVNDSSFSSGKLGLVAAALDDQGFQASFDNFEVHTVSP